MNPTFKLWLHGLGAAAIGAVTPIVTEYLQKWAALGTFPTNADIQLSAHKILATAIIVCVAYMTKSPVPIISTITTATVTETTNTKAS